MPDDTSVREAATESDVHFGAAVDPDLLRSEHEYRQTLHREFTTCTTENALKMGPLRPGPGEFDFRDADAIAGFTEKHDMGLRGHTLVWHKQIPEWVEPWSRSDRELRDILRDHVRTVAARYRGRVDTWDVVNEAIDDDNTMRESPWYDAMGEEYLDLAFQWAREADPEAELYYNDYKAEVPGDRTDAVYDLLVDLLDRDVPVDGVGLQAHMFDPDDRPEPARVAETVTRFQELGLKVQLTELDVPIREDLDHEAALEDQATYYRNLLDACLDAGVETIVTWGVADHTSWLPKLDIGEEPLLFDDNYEPKPARDAVVAALRDAKYQ